MKMTGGKERRKRKRKMERKRKDGVTISGSIELAVVA